MGQHIFQKFCALNLCGCLAIDQVMCKSRHSLLQFLRHVPHLLVNFWVLISRSSFLLPFSSTFQVDSVPEATTDHSKDSTRVPSADTSHPDGAVSTGSDTLPDLEPPEVSTAGVSVDKNTEETTLLTRGSHEVSAVDYFLGGGGPSLVEHPAGAHG